MKTPEGSIPGQIRRQGERGLAFCLPPITHMADFRLRPSPCEFGVRSCLLPSALAQPSHAGPARSTGAEMGRLRRRLFADGPAQLAE
jgi:hypothetical protein